MKYQNMFLILSILIASVFNNINAFNKNTKGNIKTGFFFENNADIKTGFFENNADISTAAIASSSGSKSLNKLKKLKQRESPKPKNFVKKFTPPPGPVLNPSITFKDTIYLSNGTFNRSTQTTNPIVSNGIVVLKTKMKISNLNDEDITKGTGSSLTQSAYDGELEYDEIEIIGDVVITGKLTTYSCKVKIDGNLTVNGTNGLADFLSMTERSSLTVTGDVLFDGKTFSNFKHEGQNTITGNSITIQNCNNPAVDCSVKIDGNINAAETVVIKNNKRDHNTATAAVSSAGQITSTNSSISITNNKAVRLNNVTAETAINISENKSTKSGACVLLNDGNITSKSSSITINNNEGQDTGVSVQGTIQADADITFDGNSSKNINNTMALGVETSNTTITSTNGNILFKNNTTANKGNQSYGAQLGTDSTVTAAHIYGCGNDRAGATFTIDTVHATEAGGGGIAGTAAACPA